MAPYSYSTGVNQNTRFCLTYHPQLTRPVTTTTVLLLLLLQCCRFLPCADVAGGRMYAWRTCSRTPERTSSSSSLSSLLWSLSDARSTHVSGVPSSYLLVGSEFTIEDLELITLRALNVASEPDKPISIAVAS